MKKFDYPSVGYWEAHFPGRALAIISFLEPVYENTVELKHADRRAIEACMRAISWRNVPAFKLFTKSQVSVVREEMTVKLERELAAHFVDEAGWPLFEKAINSTVAFIYNNGEGTKVSVHLDVPFLYILLAGIVTAVRMGKEEALKLRPLLEVYTAGNFPVGFDKEGNLLVLVAD